MLLPMGTLALLAAAPGTDTRVRAKVEEITPTITEIRHRIHQSPELGNGGTYAMDYQHGSAIPVGIRTMSLVLLDYLQRESRR